MISHIFNLVHLLGENPENTNKKVFNDACRERLISNDFHVFSERKYKE